MLLLLATVACWAPNTASPPPPSPPAPADAPPVTLPDPPFTAWTRGAPLTLVGPGGVPVAPIATAGVQVEVLQVLPVRVRVRCTGCPPPHQDVEGWLQIEAITTEPPAPAGG